MNSQRLVISQKLKCWCKCKTFLAFVCISLIFREPTLIQEEKEVLELMKAFDSGEMTEDDFINSIKSIKDISDHVEPAIHEMSTDFTTFNHKE